MYWVEIIDGEVDPDSISPVAYGPFNKHVGKGRFRVELDKNPGKTYLTVRSGEFLVKVAQKG